MTVWVLRAGELVDRDAAPPLHPVGKRGNFPTPYAAGDIEPYRSPLGAHEVTSRSQRREELKRNNLREVDPSEGPKFGYRDPKNARRFSRPKTRLSTPSQA